MTAAVHKGDETFSGTLTATGTADISGASVAVGARTVAADGALTLAAGDRLIALLSSTTGAKAATMTATHAGHHVKIVLQARAGGSYTIACTYAGSAGTATLDAAGEGIELMRIGTTWHALELTGGSTFA
ncbi:MAG: hypothetical protein IPH07_23900 [Deltaproteobacteria bacterium]|nr:hypothetical protein [Deltaproteobacteria bacterium]MBK8720596.1 hypothetical protein [Deltaproteobacteria bacterium]